MKLKDAEKLARGLLDDIGLTCIPFKFSNSKRRLGGCAFSRYKEKWIPIYLTLSKHFVLLNKKKVIKNAILHEMAHIVAGRDHFHDEVWKEWAEYFGADPCYGDFEAKVIEGRYRGVCTVCGEIHYRYRKSKSINDVFLCSCKEGKVKFKDTMKG